MMTTFPCIHCGEPVEAGEIPAHIQALLPQVPDPNYRLHLACAFRMTIGSLGHQLGLCGCLGKPNIMDDPPGLTRREAARTAQEFYRQQILKFGEDAIRRHIFDDREEYCR